MNGFATRIYVFLLLVTRLTPAIHNAQPLRGFNLSMYSPDTGELTEHDFKTMKKIGVSLIRLDFSKNALISKVPPFPFSEDNFERLHKYIMWAEKLDMKVIIDPHTFPGTQMLWTIMGTDVFYQDSVYKEQVLRLWRRIARECNGYGDVIWGYDLLNEPFWRPENAVFDLNELYRELVGVIREYDTNHAIVLEFSRKDFVNKYVKPPDWYNDGHRALIFSTHYYWPHEYTHQGVSEQRPLGQVYPDVERGWTKTNMEKQLEPVAGYAKKYAVEMVVGEFSCGFEKNGCWAVEDRDNPHPAGGGDKWLRDVTGLFEKFGFHWLYHCYEDWHGWDATVPHPRWVLLQKLINPVAESFLPCVYMTLPADNQTFTVGDTVVLSAQAGDENGHIAKIEFFNGKEKLGQDAGTPFEYRWHNVPAGSYRLWAKAVDNSGASLFARPVDIAVKTELPETWHSCDIGGVAAPGFTVMTQDETTIGCAEDDLYQPDAGFRYLYQPRQSDGEMTVRMISQTGKHENNQSGLMFTDNFEAPSSWVRLYMTGNRLVRFKDHRGTTATVDKRVHPPVYLRLLRNGDVFSAFYSSDKQDWVQVGSQLKLDIKNNYYAGLFVCAYKDVFINVADFQELDTEN